MLKVEGLSAFYGAIQAVRDVCIKVEPGEIVALLGANGAGKSTLFKCISALIPCQARQMSFLGYDLTRGAFPHQMVEWGLCQVPERRQLFGPLTVLENLRLGAFSQLRKGNKKSVEQAFDLVFSLFPILAERKKQLANTLSGGEQQMLAIARALVARPKLLLLDEPSLGLSPKVTRDIYRVLRQLNQEGLTILVAEQNVPLALGFARRGYIMELGSIRLEANCEELLSSEEIKAIYLGESAEG